MTSQQTVTSDNRPPQGREVHSWGPRLFRRTGALLTTEPIRLAIPLGASRGLNLGSPEGI